MTMKRMTTLKDHERRITAFESRSDKIEEVLASHSESIYQLRRGLIENNLGMCLILDHFGLPRITQHQVDEVLDAE
jgi:hypothetical protein